MADYNPRNRNERTRSEPKSTSLWFDERRGMDRGRSVLSALLMKAWEAEA